MLKRADSCWTEPFQFPMKKKKQTKGLAQAQIYFQHLTVIKLKYGSS